MSKSEKKSSDCKKEQKNSFQLVLLNDDVHTFDYVIDCLIEVLNFEPIQAEQCATLTHFKQECVLKTGEFKQVQVLRDELKNKGLALKIINLA